MVMVVQKAIQWSIIGILMFSSFTFYQLYTIIEGDNLEYTQTGKVVIK